ncbi:MAG: hypothetical protein GY949_22480, partial [Gammaproteobacteria bacterium]|nr:hypothetical protein [Gammaproteobacteria bacterium]
IAKLRHLKLAPCRTRDTLLPGASGLPAARERLRALQLLSAQGISRLLRVYGGRAWEICDLCESEASLADTLDADDTVLAAEIAFVVREEFAKSLTDIVFRRIMVGLNADQGRPMYAKVVMLAADELGWHADEISRQFDELVDYSESLRVA